MQLGSAYENTILSVHSALMRHDASYVEVCSTSPIGQNLGRLIFQPSNHQSLFWSDRIGSV